MSCSSVQREESYIRGYDHWSIVYVLAKTLSQQFPSNSKQVPVLKLRLTGSGSQISGLGPTRALSFVPRNATQRNATQRDAAQP
ncbi:hypothetical protein FCULG_00006573 [Fusarium culmorum]|uniref:Uncharacterized protein n=1 Tax=Fusarium culmorum TaxID=5516 RepID=A0A2T4GW74_FUSCU|nr:hypothetical protein FCULG_00006573 [Fusarium culmorum]